MSSGSSFSAMAVSSVRSRSILARYGVADEATGVLGVLGPLRMPYSRAISTVRYVASVMDGLVEWIYK